MEIFVTGGTGFIGRHLCRRLLEAGHGVTVLSRRDPGAARALCGPVGVVRGLEALGEAEAVINLAGAPILGPRWSPRRKAELRDTRVILTRKLVEAMGHLARPPRVLLSASAVGWYGDRGDEILDETAPPGEGFGAELCRDWEREAEAAAESGTRVVLMRTGPVIGPGGGLLARLRWPFLLGLGGHQGSGCQWFSWIHLHDHIALQLFLLERDDLAGPVNFTAPEPVTNLGFAETLAEVLRRPALITTPAPILRLGLGEQAEILLGSQRVIPRRALEAGFEFQYPTLEPALRQALGR